MRDDVAKLPLPKSAKRYARMKSVMLGTNWSRKVDMYLSMAADLTNQSKAGFQNKDAAGKVPHSIKGMGSSVVERLLGEDDVTAKDLYQRSIKGTPTEGRILLARIARRLAQFGYKGKLGVGRCTGGWSYVMSHLEGVDVNTDLSTIRGHFTRAFLDHGFEPRGVIDVHTRRDTDIVFVQFEIWSFPGSYAQDVLTTGINEGLYKSEGDYYFVTSCVGSTAEKIHALLDTEQPVSKAEFFRNVPLRQVFESGIAYIYYWTPAQCRIAGVDYEEVRNNGLRMWNDWAISYHKGIYDGQECYFFKHSAIEYIFCKV